MSICQGIPGLCDCDDPECNICYPPAQEFSPNEIPPSGISEPDDYFERN